MGRIAITDLVGYEYRPPLRTVKDAKDGKWNDEDGNEYQDRGDYTRVLPRWSK
jgi:hypothetical protein